MSQEFFTNLILMNPSRHIILSLTRSSDLSTIESMQSLWKNTQSPLPLRLEELLKQQELTRQGQHFVRKASYKSFSPLKISNSHCATNLKRHSQKQYKKVTRNNFLIYFKRFNSIIGRFAHYQNCLKKAINYDAHLLNLP